MKTLLLVISILVICGMNSVNLRAYQKKNSLNVNIYHLITWVGGCGRTLGGSHEFQAELRGEGGSVATNMLLSGEYRK